MKVLIEGMTCSGCSGRVEKAIKAIPGIQQVKVDLEGNYASWEGVEPALVKQAIEDIGYDVTGFEDQLTKR